MTFVCREAFAAWLFNGGVPLSYAIAVAYVLFDTRDKGVKAYNEAKKELEGSEVTTNGTVNGQRFVQSHKGLFKLIVTVQTDKSVRSRKSH